VLKDQWPCSTATIQGARPGLFVGQTGEADLGDPSKIYWEVLRCSPSSLLVLTSRGSWFHQRAAAHGDKTRTASITVSIETSDNNTTSAHSSPIAHNDPHQASRAWWH
jgi:hypothetical protein